MLIWIRAWNGRRSIHEATAAERAQMVAELAKFRADHPDRALP